MKTNWTHDETTDDASVEKGQSPAQFSNMCIGHQWLFDNSDDAGYMHWHCKNCGEAKVTTLKTDGGEVPDYLAAQSIRPSAADIERLCLLGSYRGDMGSVANHDSPILWSTERLREAVAQQRAHSLRALKDQGVTDADIEWWEGLNEEEKNQIKRSEFAFQIALLQNSSSQNLQSPEEKLRKLNRVTLVYSDFPLEESIIQRYITLGYSEEDYPLPWQLQKRCKWFATRCFITFRKKWFKETAESFNTMNAFYRSQIREGKI